MAEPRAAGTIYDLGYQRYSGERFGRGYAIWTLFKFSFNAAFGIGRGARARLVPNIVLLIVFLPAIVQVGAASLTSMTQFINYAQYLEFTAFLVALFAASQGPELVVNDRQNGVMSLYLSRPLHGPDYALAKLGALVAALLVLTLGPETLLFLGKVFISTTPWTAFKAEWRKIIPIIGGTLGTAWFMASISLAIASRAGRRMYANASVIGFFLLFPAAVSLFHNLASGDAKRYAVLVHPMWLLRGFVSWLFEVESRRRSVIGRADLPGSAYLYALIGICLLMSALFLLRYRKSEA